MAKCNRQGDPTLRSSGPRRGLPVAALAVATLVSSGCVITGFKDYVQNGFKVGPNYAKPPAPVAQEWIQAKDPRTQGPPPRDGNWWEVFQDPVLNALIVRAYQQNPNLRSVGTRVLQARAIQAIAVGNIFPQSMQLSGLYPNGTVFSQPFHFDFTGFNLNWELDFWGRYRRQIESANAALDASVENYDDALVTLLADVATNYVDYRITQLRIKIAQDNLSTQEKLVAIVTQQQKVGTATELDMRQLRQLMQQTRSSIPALRITLGLDNDRLCILLGEPPHNLEPELGPGPDLGSLPMPKTPQAVAAGIPADLLRRRPDVRAAERLVAAQNPQIGVAQASLYPSIGVSTILGDLDTQLPVLGSNHSFLGFVQPEFSWNLLNFGRLANNVHLQEAKTQELIAAYQNRVLVAAQEVQSSLRAFLRSQEQAEALSGSAADAAAAAKIGEDLFNQVKATVNRLFILENTRLQTQDQLAVAQGNIALDLINVYRALGGGWELRTQMEAPCATEPRRPRAWSVGIGRTRLTLSCEGEQPVSAVDAPALVEEAPARIRMSGYTSGANPLDETSLSERPPVARAARLGQPIAPSMPPSK
jgi:NodT family efflux transporter outer membrane factor (OMF) lipoprotein